VEEVTTCLSEAELGLVERLVEAREVSRSETIRQAIRRGTREELIRLALQRYRDGEVGMGGGAEQADVTIAQVMAEANDRNVLANYDEADPIEDVDALR